MTLFARSLCLVLLIAPGLASAGSRSKQEAAPVQNPTVLAVYVPPSDLEDRYYSSRHNVWVEPGRALDESVDEIGKAHFPNLVRIDTAHPVPYGLLLDLNPKWSLEGGKVKMTLQYNVFGPDGAKLHSGSREVLAAIKAMNITNAAYAAARQAVQYAMMDAQFIVKPDPAKFPPVAAKLDSELLVDRTKPLRTGTGFFINATGQLLTAAHVQRGCTVMEARKDGKAFPVTRRAASDLLDVAVLDSGQAPATSLPFRNGQKLVLGESVTSVGYPLQGLLSESPNLTRGNVSAASGLKGSYGEFQFSAPIQPGNSGGPIVSDNGELLGMAVGTLNAKYLVDKGLLPQNVNFALDSNYVARFLRRENVAFQEIQPKGAGEMKIANDAALGASVQLACYE
jgi:S1-C subfamily serine protease